MSRPLIYRLGIRTKIADASASVANRIFITVNHKYLLPTVDIFNGDQECAPEPIMQDICLPPYYGSGTHDDWKPLRKILLRESPKIVIEIGTGFGNLTANICQTSKDATVYTVNPPSDIQTGDIVTFELTSDEIGRVYRSNNFESRVIQILENSWELDLTPHLAGAQADLAVIDGCHDTDFVINDFEVVAPHIRPGGLVIFHDTHPSMERHLSGSYKACVALRKRGLDIKQVSGSWWAQWRKEPVEGMKP